MNGAGRYRGHVAGAPYQTGERVRVVCATSWHVHDAAHFYGRSGVVEYLDYDCGCSQTFPTDPVIVVSFSHGARGTFRAGDLIRKPTLAPYIVERFRAYMRRNGVLFHVVLEDGNTSDCFAEAALADARAGAGSDLEGLGLAIVLRGMSPTQRRKLAHRLRDL